MTGKPALPAAIAALCLALMMGVSAPGAAAADDMAVKMQWDETLYRDEVSRVNLEITNINDRTMNVTSASLYIDWMRLGTFATNTTPLQLDGGQRGVMTIVFRVPVDAKYGKHSDYVVLNYSLYNDSSGAWTKGTFESEITKDFTVVEKLAPAQDWFAASFTNALCVTGLVVGILVVAALVSWRLGRRRRSAVMTPIATPKPAPVEESPPSPPPAPPEEKHPEGPERCPICGAPWPGKHCQVCDWDIG